MAVKVLVTPRSFATFDDKPLTLLNKAGIEVKLNPYGRILTTEEMKVLVQDVDGIIIGVDPLDKKIIDCAPNLKVISKYGVGTDNIDVNYASNQNIKVTTTQGANTDAVAEYTIALMLAVSRKVVQIDRECRNLNWGKITSLDMYQKTLGLIGVGQIGKTVIRRLRGFNMNILAYDPNRDYNFAKKYKVSYVDNIDDVLQQSDFISLHVPLNEDTKNIIDERELKMMKSNAVLINTARGGLINENALIRVLEKNKIWGAGLDVFEEEPPSNNRLLSLNNLVIGSHCAASTKQAIINMGRLATEQLIKSLGLGVKNNF